MALVLVAIDPGTDGDHCPAAFIEEQTGDLLFQGWTVTDLETLADAERHSPAAEDEFVVRLPARMREVIMEALNRLFRVYSSSVIPGFLQRPAYAHALLSAITVFRGTPDDVDDAVPARMNRNRVLTAGDHQFRIVLEESVLRYQVDNAEVMAGQLGHLLGLMSLPSVSLGVIPFSASRRPMWTLETFTVFDDSRVHVELLSTQVTQLTLNRQTKSAQQPRPQI